MKCEEVFRNQHRDLGQAKRSIERFFEKAHNENRLLSALDYHPSAELKAHLPCR